MKSFGIIVLFIDYKDDTYLNFEGDKTDTKLLSYHRSLITFSRQYDISRVFSIHTFAYDNNYSYLLLVWMKISMF
jgi:hypothetical protein